MNRTKLMLISGSVLGSLILGASLMDTKPVKSTQEVTAPTVGQEPTTISVPAFSPTPTPTAVPEQVAHPAPINEPVAVVPTPEAKPQPTPEPTPAVRSNKPATDEERNNPLIINDKPTSDNITPIAPPPTMQQ